MADAQYWITKLGLTPHAEGGWFSETYRSPDLLSLAELPEGSSGSRPCSTAIYFLVTHVVPSRFHRLRSDEIWHFYEGMGLTLHCLHPDGSCRTLTLGREPERGQQFQAVIPRGVWMAAEVEKPDGFALVGCTVAPGFVFDDFELGVRAKLVEDFPEHKALIMRLTKA